MNSAINSKIKLVHTWLLLLWAFTMAFPTGVVNTLMGMVAFIFILRCIIVRDIKFRNTAVLIPFLLFFFASLLSLFNSVNMKDSIHGLTKVLRSLALVLVVLHSVEDNRSLRKVIYALLLGAAFICIDGIYQYFVGSDFLRGNLIVENIGLRRISASFSGANDFGVYLVTLTPLAWVLSLYYLKSKQRILGIILAGFLTSCLLLTYGRGSFLGLLVVCLIFILVKKDKFLIALFCLFLIITPFIMPKSVKNWIKQVKSPLVILSNEDRIIMYRTAIEMIKAHPVVGVGVNTFVDNYPKYKVPEFGFTTPDKSYAHNSYLQMGAEIGIFGLVIFLWLIYVFIQEVGRIYKKTSDNFIRSVALGLCCGVLGFLLNGLTESNLYYSRLSILFWFIIGLTLSNKFIDEKEIA